MSKMTKLFNTPGLFFKDAIKKLVLSADEFSNIGAQKIKARKISGISDYVDPIINFRDLFPINRIKYKGDFFWPFLKSELIIHSLIAWKKKLQVINFNPFFSQMCHETHISYDMIKQFKEHLSCKSVEDLKFKKTDFLFFTAPSSVEQIETKSGLYHKITDPILEYAETRGTVEKIEIVKVANKNVYKSGNFIREPISVIPNHITKSGFYHEFDLPANLLQKIEKFIPHIKITEANLKQFFDWQVNQIEFYTDLLKKFNPEVVFFFPFFYNTPLVYAANKLGIKTVELQHGIMAGENNCSYDNWQEIPKEGYEALPSHFWVWGDYEYERMSKVLKTDRQSKHKVVNGGYPWLDKSLEIAKDADKLNKIKKYIQASQKEKVALITLQGHNPLPSKHMLELIKKTENKIIWLIRKHPKGRKENAAKVTMTDNILSDKIIDSVSISNLFQIVDFHFTENSTSVVEADYFGVYNYVYDIAGYNNYKEYIDNELMGYFSPDNMEDVHKFVVHFDVKDRKRRLNYVSAANLEQVFDAIRNDE